MELTDDEKRDAAMGMRSLAFRALEDAKTAANPQARARFEEQARRHQALAEKFERARKL